MLLNLLKIITLLPLPRTSNKPSKIWLCHQWSIKLFRRETVRRLPRPLPRLEPSKISPKIIYLKLQALPPLSSLPLTLRNITALRNSNNMLRK